MEFKIKSSVSIPQHDHLPSVAPETLETLSHQATILHHNLLLFSFLQLGGHAGREGKRKMDSCCNYRPTGKQCILIQVALSRIL